MPRARRKTSKPSYLYPAILLGVLLVIGVALGIAPRDRHTWLAENGLAVVGILILVPTWRFFPLSNISYTSIFVLLVLHEIGAHYTYSYVPYDEWIAKLTGGSLEGAAGFDRNQYDRFVHFTYGLLIAYPIREVVIRVANVRGFWGYFFPLDVIMSTSMLYELIEWGAAVVFGGDLGQSYLGTQGDEWDGQKDMALAALGALIALTITAIVHRSLQRDFHREWAESLRIKSKRPLGEVSIERLKAGKPV